MRSLAAMECDAGTRPTVPCRGVELCNALGRRGSRSDICCRLATTTCSAGSSRSRSKSSSSRRWGGRRMVVLAAAVAMMAVFAASVSAHGIGGHHDDDEDAPPPVAPPAAANGSVAVVVSVPPPPPGDSSSSLTANKGGAIVVFFVIPIIGCFLPRLFPIPKYILTLGVLFAAGLFFCLSIGHLLYASASSFQSLVKTDYPIAYILCVLGYFLTWLSDIVVRAVWEKQAEKKAAAAAAQAGLLGAGGAAANQTAPEFMCCKAKAQQMSSDDKDDEEAAIPKCCSSNGQQQSDGMKAAAAVCSGDGCPCQGSDGVCNCAKPSWFEFDAVEQIAKTGTPSVLQELSPAEAAVLLAALCFHGVFEGLAVGLSSTVGSVWSVTLTVVWHKFVEGIALGTTLLARTPPPTILVYLLYSLAFSLMAPVGIAIGMILDTTTPPSSAIWVEAIGNGLASGVFVFVAVGHLMVKAMKPADGDRWWAPFPKIAACALGALVNALLMLSEK